MDKRKITAQLMDIANDLDSYGMYEEADKLTKLAQNEGFLGGLKQTGRGIVETGKGLYNTGAGLFGASYQAGKDLGEAAREGFKDLVGSNAAAAAQMQGSSSGFGVEDIKRLTQQAKFEMSRNKPQLAEQYANEAVMTADKLLARMPPVGSSTAANNARSQVQQLVLEARGISRQLAGPRGAYQIGARSQEGQLKTSREEVNNWIANRLRATPGLTKKQLYDMALAEKDMNFANNVASFLVDKGFTAPTSKPVTNR